MTTGPGEVHASSREDYGVGILSKGIIRTTRFGTTLSLHGTSYNAYKWIWKVVFEGGAGSSRILQVGS